MLAKKIAILMASGTSVGLVTSLLIAGHSLWRGSTPPTKPIRDASFLSEWNVDETGLPPCSFYNATFQFKGALCSHFAIARMNTAIQQQALERAMECAVHFDTDCILSTEIGLSVPAAFVYDEVTGLQMVVAPKLELIESVQANVDLHLPNNGDKTGVSIRLNKTIKAHFLQGGSRELKTELFEGSSAYCIQLLRLSLSSDCWEQID